MPLELILEEAIFIEKHNRFLCTIELNGEFWPCHIPNTGRLKELLFKGNTVGVRYVASPTRKTAYEVILAKKDNIWYSVDSRMPNALVKSWATLGYIPQWLNCELIGERTFGKSRFDFEVRGERPGYIEVKGVTLERQGIGYFPDAPTERGRKHLMELLELRRAGLYAAVVFVCQSEAITAFHPNDETDPEFGKLLRELARNHVDILCLQAKITFDRIEFIQQIPCIMKL